MKIVMVCIGLIWIMAIITAVVVYENEQKALHKTNNEMIVKK